MSFPQVEVLQIQNIFMGIPVEHNQFSVIPESAVTITRIGGNVHRNMQKIAFPGRRRYEGNSMLNSQLRWITSMASQRYVKNEKALMNQSFRILLEEQGTEPESVLWPG